MKIEHLPHLDYYLFLVRFKIFKRRDHTTSILLLMRVTIKKGKFTSFTQIDLRTEFNANNGQVHCSVCGMAKGKMYNKVFITFHFLRSYPIFSPLFLL